MKLALVIASLLLAAPTLADQKPVRLPDVEMGIVGFKPAARTTVGIEGKILYRYAGPELRALPAHEKSLLTARIADSAQDGDAMIYDIRFIGVREGVYDLRTALERIDGKPLTDAPKAIIAVGGILPEDHDGLLTMTTGRDLDKFGGYRTALIIFGAVWLAPLALVIVKRLRRRKPAPVAAIVAGPPTLADQLRPLVEAAIAGRATTADQARLELLLIAHWREKLALEKLDSHAALQKIRADAGAGSLLGAVEIWLHAPARAERARPNVAELLAPYRAAPAAAANGSTTNGSGGARMTLSHPLLLLALVIPLALGAWELRRRGFRIAIPVDHGNARRARFLPHVIAAANLLPALILAAAIILLAGPKRLGPPGEERVLTNIEICLDVSGSMTSPMSTAPDGASRYITAMKAIDDFTTKRKGDAFGLTIFGGEVVRWVPLTKDTSAIRSATPFLDPATLPPGLNSTRVGHALRFCNQILSQQPEGDRLVILLTDGFSSDLDGGAAQAIGGELLGSNVVVHAIHVGDGAPPQQLTEVVAPTGGGVFSATNLQSLTGVFEHIDRMHKIRIKPTQREAIDDFTPFALAGVIVAGLCFLALFGVRYTPW